MTGASDWLITAIRDSGPGHYYRFHIEGVNLASDPLGGSRFSWSVRDISDPRYGVSAGASDAVRTAVANAKAEGASR